MSSDNPMSLSNCNLGIWIMWYVCVNVHMCCVLFHSYNCVVAVMIWGLSSLLIVLKIQRWCQHTPCWWGAGCLDVYIISVFCSCLVSASVLLMRTVNCLRHLWCRPAYNSILAKRPFMFGVRQNRSSIDSLISLHFSM